MNSNCRISLASGSAFSYGLCIVILGFIIQVDCSKLIYLLQLLPYAAEFQKYFNNKAKLTR